VVEVEVMTTVVVAVQEVLELLMAVVPFQV
jgi:hypothetical protein